MMGEWLLTVLLAIAPALPVTGYTPYDCTPYQASQGWCDGWTTAGTRTTVGRTAACPETIPLGARVYIEGVGWRTCEDRGCDCVDVFVPDSAAARDVTGDRRVVVMWAEATDGD